MSASTPATSAHAAALGHDALDSGDGIDEAQIEEERLVRVAVAQLHNLEKALVVNAELRAGATYGVAQ